MLWPQTTRRTDAGELRIGGVGVGALAEEFGTPLYIYDEATIRGRAALIRDAFAATYPRTHVVYAGKALLNTAILRIVRDEGYGLDVVSGGELYAGLHAGFDPAEITFHGNNKSRAELEQALAAGIGRIVIDNDHEIELLGELTRERETPVAVLLRLNPAIDVHTHEKIATGVADSKFGFPIATGQAERAVEAVRAQPGLDLVGYHAHIGSQIFEAASYVETIDELLAFAAAMRERHGVAMRELSPGGGYGIAYLPGEEPADVESWAGVIADAVKERCAKWGLPVPALTVEPGRSIIGPAGVALYTIGAIKTIPGVRTYVSIDGGMADNIRPALYGARYHAEIANRCGHDASEPVTIAGKYCESGDLLIERVELPPVQAGDLLAIPAAGAYCLAMASNYNLAPRPAAVLVRDGEARLIRERESYADLVRFDR